MKYLIIAYKSRNNLFSVNRVLNLRGISTRVINTPHRLSISCGLSIRVDIKSLEVCKSVVQEINLNGFMGIFLVEINNGNDTITRVF